MRDIILGALILGLLILFFYGVKLDSEREQEAGSPTNKSQQILNTSLDIVPEPTPPPVAVQVDFQPFVFIVIKVKQVIDYQSAGYSPNEKDGQVNYITFVTDIKEYTGALTGLDDYKAQYIDAAEKALKRHYDLLPATIEINNMDASSYASYSEASKARRDLKGSDLDVLF